MSNQNQPSTPIVVAIYSLPRLHIQATLKVASGRGGRFQPATYANQGPCYYKIPGADGVLRDALIVDTPQAMANWLEYVCWPAGREDYLPEFQGIPYVKVLDGDNNSQFLTSSVLESHRLNSRYIYESKPTAADTSLGLEVDKEFRDFLKTKYFKTNNNRPFPMGRFLSKIFDLDPACLLHGFFMAGGDGFEGLEGRARWMRTLAASVHAEDPQRLFPGGAYVDHVCAKNNIPHTGDHATSSKVTMDFILNVQALKDFQVDVADHESGLTNLQVKFLIAFALRKILSLTTERGFFQPRSWCEFQFEKVEVVDGEDGSKWDNISAKAGEDSAKLKLATEFDQLKKAIFEAPFQDLPEDLNADAETELTEEQKAKKDAKNKRIAARKGITLVFNEKYSGEIPLDQSKTEILREFWNKNMTDIGLNVSFDRVKRDAKQKKPAFEGIKGIYGYLPKDAFDAIEKKIATWFKDWSPEGDELETLGSEFTKESIKSIIEEMIKSYRQKIEKRWKDDKTKAAD
ncbi:MAG: type I-U CRISPR-associated RAMP protein Csb1/Cas7u [Verrucomicrobiia bacterium]